MRRSARAASMRGLEADAMRALDDAFGSREEAVTAFAPGRSTLVGEHVDYAAGMVLCIAIDLGVAVALRLSPDGMYRAVSAGQRVARVNPAPAGDLGDRVFAAGLALRRYGVDVPPYEVALAADVPAGAGLASSAAVICAVIAAVLRIVGGRLSAHNVVSAALTAERDIVGVACGSLDQHAVVESPEGGALLLDCRNDSWTAVPWPWRDVVLCACNTGEQHDVGGAEYRSRRAQTELALRELGVTSAQEITAEMIEGAGLPLVEGRRARHVASETARAVQAARAMREGDAHHLGRLMTESHRSLRDDHEVSTQALDAAVAAALRVPGCHGARMVGAGFGGTVVALVESDSASECAAAMSGGAGGHACSSWVLRPCAGLMHLASDVVTSG